jgi:hypothetical protein
LHTLDLSYRSGAEVLEALWGFLNCGGLLVRHQARLDRGVPVVCRVAIESQREVYEVPGRVLSERANHEGQYYVAFDRSDAQDRLLAASWAEAERVPQRRWRRVPCDVPVQVRSPAGVETVRMTNVSRGGCCLRGGVLPPGSTVSVDGPGVHASGHVRWTTRGPAGEMGIAFEAPLDVRAVDSLSTGTPAAVSLA